VLHPRQRFLAESRAGLFLHWGIRTAPAHPAGESEERSEAESRSVSVRRLCVAWEAAVTGGGWDPAYWVREARKLHARYLVLACFHSRLGYGRAWPSRVPGSYHTRRDFLRELLDAAAPHGMRVLVYVTDDPQWWNEGLPAGQSWLDSTAYSAFKGRDVDLHTRDGFGEFAHDAVVEVMQRYGDLGGFWIDRDNEHWERVGLYERIHRERPHFTLTNNHQDTPEMDVVCHAERTGMTPPYDFPQAVDTAPPRVVEAAYTLSASGAWWFDGTDAPVDRRLALGRYVANAGSSIASLLAGTAMTNGRLPPNQEAFNDFAAGYLGAIWASIGGTEGGGYQHGGLQPGCWNDGAHGVTTLSAADPDLHHVHVLTRPSGDTLRVRDNGYRVLAVRDLRTGAPVAFSQADGVLTLTGVSTWDEYDTVFTVTTGGRDGIYPPTEYAVSASACAAGHPAAHVTDGDPATFWDNDRTLPVSLCFDLGTARPVRYIGLNQREDSPAGTDRSARIRDYRVYFSPDEADPACAGTLPSHRGVQFIDLPAATGEGAGSLDASRPRPGTFARHVRLEVLSTWAAPTDPQRHRRVRLVRAWIGHRYVDPR
jgi:alpha-L-fucosidase